MDVCVGMRKHCRINTLTHSHFFFAMALTQTPQWVAAYTSPRSEKKVTERIEQELGLEAYVPLHRVLRKWSDRVKSVEVPLIPSYTFVKLRECDLWSVRGLQGICGFVTFPSTGIAVIPERDILSIRRFAESMEEVYVCNADQLKVGAYVKVIGGEFEGLTGVITDDKHGGNFAVEIADLNLYLTATVQQDLLQVIDAPQKQPVGLFYK